MASNINPSKCSVTIETPHPIFAGSKITLKVQLFDFMKNPVDKVQFNHELLILKVNGLFCGDVEPLNVADNDVNALYLGVSELGCKNDINCVIQLEYGNEQIGKDLNLDITHVIPFKEDSYIIKGVSFPCYSFKIIGIPIYKLRGDDGAVVNNINRIINSENRLELNDFKVDQYASQGNARHSSSRYSDIDVDISKFKGNHEECEQIYNLLTLFIKGLHYRDQAFKFNKKREEWEAKAIKENENENFQKSSDCKKIKERYSKLMDEAHSLASDALFKFYNKNRQSNQIDLHGQLVADENKLEEYRDQLIMKGHSEVEAKKEINEERTKLDEALSHLREARVESQRGRDWLEIIVGAGHHSADNRQKIRPKVEKFLKDLDIHDRFEIRECNKGALLIKYKEYTGEEPCFGSFYCKECRKTWYSPLCWKGYWQLCFRCFKKDIQSECYPMKLTSRSEHTSRKARNPSSFTSEEHRKLCQKCLVTRTYCKYLRN